MGTEDLSRSERASRRAAQLMEMGEPEMAFKSYQEAAEYMLCYARETVGQHKADAQKLTELLLKKAMAAKALAAAQRAQPENTESVTAAPAAPVVKATEAPVPENAVETKETAVNRAGKKEPAVTPPPRTDNNQAISRDLDSVRKNSRTGSDPDLRMKFVPVPSMNVRFSDIAGLDNVKSIVRLKIIEPILHPELFRRFGKSSNGGILLYGPPGTGKTMIARAIATETNLDFFSVRCSDIVGKSFGDGERNLKGLFDAARESGHAMIFFDEFESLACKRGGNSTVMNRIVPELLSQMDGFQKNEGTLVVLASTNRPWDLDSAVLRPPRMTERIYVGLPDFPAREYMIRKAMEPLPKQEMLDYEHIADALEGFNCADITAFVERVKEAPIQRGLFNNDIEQYITAQDVEDALAASRSSVQKSDLEAFVKWETTQQ